MINQANGGVFGASANALSSGLQGLTGAANPYALSTTMNQFVNPYRSQVIDDAMRRSTQQQSQDLNTVRGQAAGASAYGGARQGLVEAELMDRYSQNNNEMVSRLLQEGYTSSANLGLASLGQQTSASGMLVDGASSAFNLGNASLQQQQSAGSQIQALLQGVLGQGASQYDQYVNYPNTSLSTALAGIQGNPLQGAGTTTQTYNPGLFDYMKLGASTMTAGK